MNPVIFEPATLADVDAIHALEQRLFPTDAWSEAMIRDELEAPHRYYLVARENGSLIGYGGLLALAPEGDVQTIGVDPDRQGRGIGRQMLTELLKHGAEHGLHTVFLEVRADNTTAQTLYESLGFETIATRPAYYQPGNIDALVMRLHPLRQALQKGQS